MNMHPLHHMASQIPEQLIGQWCDGATVYFSQFTAAAAAALPEAKGAISNDNEAFIVLWGRETWRVVRTGS